MPALGLSFARYCKDDFLDEAVSDNGSLDGLAILSCRQANRGLELDDEVEAAGGMVVRLPLIEVAPPKDGGAALADAVGRLESFDWVACTSVNGVESLAGIDLPAGVRLAAVGPSTAEAFERVLGRSALVVPRVQTALGLVAGFPPRPGRVLAPLAELASDDLAVGLTERGFEVEVVTAYSTATPSNSPAAISAAAEADVVLISSPSIAARLTQVLGDHLPSVAIATGPKSAAAAVGRFEEVIESTPDGAFESLLEVAARRFD